MKKKILTVCVLFTTVVFAQKKWAIELKGGANVLSNIILDEDDNGIKSKSGFLGGVLGTYFLSDSFGIKSGFLYDQRGFKVEEVEGVEIKDLKFKISSLTLPFYAQYETNGNLKGFFFGGPYISIPLDTKIGDIDGKNPDVDFGIGAGAGLIAPITDLLEFIGDVSYKIGINKSLYGDGRLYDLGVTVGLRYRF